MCSILGILDIKSDVAELRKLALQLSKKQRHRGPDWSGIYVNANTILAHERLAIVDIDNGAQPLYSHDKNLVLAVNGEIYNHEELEAALTKPYKFQTKSDCEIINALYAEKGVEFLNDLNGIFAFVLYDNNTQSYLIARDHIGIVPLYTGHDEHGNLYVASEMKALIDRVGMVAIANDDMLKRKIGAAVVAVRRAGGVFAFDALNHFFLISQMIVVGSTYWNVGIGRDIGEVKDDAEGLDIMKVLGENMAWLMKRI